jgi:rubredoxin
MKHSLFRAMRVLEKVLTYVPGEGAACPVCGVRLRVTSTALRERTLVKRRHKCDRCDWNFSSVEEVQPEAREPLAEPEEPIEEKRPPAAKSTRPLPVRRKACQDKAGKRT